MKSVHFVRPLALALLLAATCAAVPAVAQEAGDAAPAAEAAPDAAPTPDAEAPPAADTAAPSDAAPVDDSTTEASEPTPAPAASSPPQSTTSSSETLLPEVDVIQDTPQQRRAKKQQVQLSPLTQASPAPAASGAAAAAGTVPAGDGDPATGDFETVAPITLPSAVSTASEQDVEREGTKQVQKVLEKQVPSVTLSDAAGSPARAELQFRGFDSSPVTGRAQGLAVYQNGIRINEAFGDTVNWSFVPTNAIAAMSVISNNPTFGLNALGGAVSIIMKDGFSFQGVEFDIMGGSFGRIQSGIQIGASSGNAAAYAALEGIWEDGFRDFSESEIRRFFGDVALRGSKAEVHLSLTAASNEFGATAAAPVELLARDYSNTFTSPQTSDLEMFMPSLSGTVKATDTMTLSGVAYYRRYKAGVVDGNVAEFEECDPGPFADSLCVEDDAGDPTIPVRDFFTGALIDDDEVDEDRIGSIERLNTSSRSWGGVFELQEKAKLFDRPNQFVFGVSYDKGKTNYRTSSELGQIGSQYVVTGTGITLSDPEPDGENELSPRNLNSENTYWGIYFSNAFDVTDQLTVTVGGRWNHATIKLEDLTGNFDGLNATNTYVRFNPQVGANYKITPGLSIYGGYSESNRAPTPAELGCAEPENPCLVESFLTDDPPLAQVVGRTAEIGLRGQGYAGSGQFSWGAGLFRTLAEDDILPVADGARVFFVNGGDTLRQGIELYGAYGIEKKWNVYGSYAFVDATLDECSQPNDDGECAFLRQGNRLPGIPRHLFKAGFEYWLTPKWKFGADLIASSKRPFFRNETASELGRFDDLAGYTRVDLHTSYDVTENIQVYGFIKNLFNQKYGLYGTYFEADEVTEVDAALGGPGLVDPRTISPSQPFAAYGGIRIKY